MSDIVKKEDIVLTDEQIRNITFDILETVRTSLVNKVVQVNKEKKWPQGFKLNSVESIYSELLDYSKNQPTTAKVEFLSSVQMDVLGFLEWSAESGLRLIPYWAVDFIENTIVESTEGNKYMLSTISDFNIVSGCIEYGIIPNDFVKSETNGQPIPESLK